MGCECVHLNVAMCDNISPPGVVVLRFTCTRTNRLSARPPWPPHLPARKRDKIRKSPPTINSLRCQSKCNNIVAAYTHCVVFVHVTILFTVDVAVKFCTVPPPPETHCQIVVTFGYNLL